MILRRLRQHKTLSVSFQLLLAVTMILPPIAPQVLAQDARPDGLSDTILRKRGKQNLDWATLEGLDVDPEFGTLLCQMNVGQVGQGPLAINLAYQWRDLGGKDSSLGSGWAFSGDMRLEMLDKESPCLIDETGHRRWFLPSGNGFEASRGRPARILKNEQGYELKGLGDDLRYQFDAQGQILFAQDSYGHKREYSYAGGKLASIQNPEGLVRFERNSEGRIQRANLPGKRTVNISYNKSGRMARVTNSRKLYWTYKYDMYGRLTHIGDDAAIIRYDPWNRVIRLTGKNVRTRRFFYMTSADPIRSYITLVEDAGRRLALYGKSFDGKFIERIDEQNRRTTLEVDERDRVIAFHDANNQKWEYGYDEQGRHKVTEGPTGELTVYEYQGSNSKPSVIKQGDKRWSFGFDKFGNVKSITNPTGAVETRAYNDQGKIAKVKHFTGLEISYSYDDNGHVSKSVDNLKRVNVYKHDALGQMTQWTRPDGVVYSVSYGQDGKVESLTDSRGRSVRYSYNRFGKIQSEVNEYGTRVDYKYNRFGQLRALNDEVGLIQHFDYDRSGRLAAVTDALGQTTRYTYKHSKLIVTEPTGAQHSYRYNRAGEVKNAVLPNGRKISFEYNKQGLVSKQTNPDGSEASFAYNKSGLMTAMRDSDSEFRFVYNKLGQIKTLIDGALKKSIHYEYDKAGQRSKMTLPFGEVSYERDALGRISAIKDVDGQSIRITYGFDGRRERIEYPNGTVTRFEYNKRDKLAAIITTGVTTGKDKKVLSARRYTYDKAGRRASTTNEKGEVESYSYDARGRLLRVERGQVVKQYSYDGANNRTSETTNGKLQRYTIGKGNRVLSTGREKLEYDASGNLVRRIGKTVVNYKYDSQNKLIGIVKGKGKSKSVIRFGYAANGTRIWREVNGKRRYFLNDFADVVAEYSADGKLIKSYTHGPEDDDVLAAHKDSKSYYYHYDAVRSVVAMTDSKGGLAASYDYDVFGKIRSKSGQASLWNPYAYTSRRRDPGTELYFYRARSYSASLGRFTSLDPMGFFDGPNRYAYAQNNPVMFRDPYGLWSIRGAWNSVKKKASGAWKSFKSTKVGAFTVGFGKGLKNGAVGLYQMVRHPIQTTKAIYGAVVNYEQTLEAFGDMWDKYKDAYHRDPHKFWEMTGQLTAEVAFAVVGTKGLGAVTKVSNLAKVGQKVSTVSRATGLTRAAGTVGGRVSNTAARVTGQIASKGRVLADKAGRVGAQVARRYPKGAAVARALATNGGKAAQAVKKAATNTAKKFKAIDRARAMRRAALAARGGNFVTRPLKKLAAVPGAMARTGKFAVRNPGTFLAYGTYNLGRGTLRLAAGMGKGALDIYYRKAGLAATLLFQDQVTDAINKYKNQSDAAAAVTKQADKVLAEAPKLSGEALDKALDETQQVYRDYRDRLMKPVLDETNKFNAAFEKISEESLNAGIENDAILSRMERELDSFVERRTDLMTEVFTGKKPAEFQKPGGNQAAPQEEQEHNYRNPAGSRLTAYENEAELLVKIKERVQSKEDKDKVQQRIDELAQRRTIEEVLFRSGDHETLMSYLAGEEVDLTGALGIPGMGAEVDGEGRGMTGALEDIYDDVSGSGK